MNRDVATIANHILEEAEQQLTEKRDLIRRMDKFLGHMAERLAFSINPMDRDLVSEVREFRRSHPVKQ